MIHDLDASIGKLLNTQSEPDSLLAGADISFDIPDTTWRDALDRLAVNCYLYEVHENVELRTYESVASRRNTGDELASYRSVPRRVDCAYCITAWSTASTDAVLEEHRILGQILKVLLKNPILPESVLEGDLKKQITPYPTVIASAEGMKNNPHFWSALGQQLKPSLNYIITLTMLLDDGAGAVSPVVNEIRVVEQHL